MTRTLISLALLILFLSPILMPAEGWAGDLGYNRKAKTAERNRDYSKRRSDYDDQKKREAQEKAWQKDRDARQEAWQNKSDARRVKAQERKKKRRRGSERDAAEERDYRNRTSGRACMYGADGKVIFRPRGASCRGDSPRGSEAEGPRMQLQPLESIPAAPKPRSTARPKSAEKKTRRTGR